MTRSDRKYSGANFTKLEIFFEMQILLGLLFDVSVNNFYIGQFLLKMPCLVVHFVPWFEKINLELNMTVSMVLKMHAICR